ncbi:MAG: hypothetical protein KCHDKBKB_01375 [Elusimicrobia bacterium]|nr:hypothetical protein [Elusimicrobiota bacterium]
MGKLRWSFMLLAGLLLSGPVKAALEDYDTSLPPVKIRVLTVGAWQDLQQKNNNGTLPQIESGFHAALANLELFTTVMPGIDVYADFYLSSRRHLGTLYAREGYLMISKLPDHMNVLNINDWFFKYFKVKGGHFELDFGQQHLYRSDNADIYRNPLIGNYVVDPNTVEGGVELIGDFNWLHLVGGISNGVTTEKFTSGRAYSNHGKVLIEPKSKKFFLAGSYYRVHHSSNATTELFSALRSGSRYAGVFGPTSVDGDPDAGQVFMGKGYDVTAYQFDAGFTLSRLAMSGLWGWYEDADTNSGLTAGTPAERWTYWGAEAKVDITQRFYAATRFSAARSSIIRGVEQDGRVGRFQVGGGYKIADGMLFKVEYVDQRYQDFKGTNPAHINAQDPRFRGVISEFGVKFGATAFGDKSE